MMRCMACLVGYLLLASPVDAASIALSFENAPSAPTPLLGNERAKTLIAGLKDADVDQAIFFAVGKYLDRDGLKRLKAYADAGHLIGSEGYSHQTVDELGGREFVDDLKHNDLLVKDLPAFKMWVRFPELNQGSTVEARDFVREWVYHMLYGRSQVTVDTPDEMLDRMIQSGVASGRRPDREKLRQLYVSVMMSCVRHYDDLARSTLGASPVHTLRLHENDLAALFVPDLVRELRAEGFAVVSATEALNEPLNRYEVDLVPLNGSHILGIAKERGIADASPAPVESQEVLARAISSSGVWD